MTRRSRIGYKYHCQERALERYGIGMSTNDVDTVSQMIIDGYADYIGFGRNKRSIWKMYWENTAIYPLFDFDKKIIITFLTKSMAYDTAKRQRTLDQNS